MSAVHGGAAEGSGMSGALGAVAAVVASARMCKAEVDIVPRGSAKGWSVLGGGSGGVSGSVWG